jgi:hypothetical protein
MRSIKTKIGAGATLLALGGLAAYALSAGAQEPATTAAAKSGPVEVRTETVHRTVRVVKHEKRRRNRGASHASGAPAAPAAAPSPAPARVASSPAPAPAPAAAPAPRPATRQVSNSGPSRGGDDHGRDEAEPGDDHGGDEHEGGDE